MQNVIMLAMEDKIWRSFLDPHFAQNTVTIGVNKKTKKLRKDLKKQLY